MLAFGRSSEAEREAHAVASRRTHANPHEHVDYTLHEGETAQGVKYYEVLGLGFWGRLLFFRILVLLAVGSKGVWSRFPVLMVL